MAYPFQHEESYLESLPESGEDDAGQMLGAYQDSSAQHQYDVNQHLALYHIHHPDQYASRYAAPHSIQHMTQYQSQQMHPSQFQTQYPNQYPTQQPIEDTGEYSNDCSHHNMYEDIEDYTDKDLDDNSGQDMEDNTDEGPCYYPMDDSIEDIIEQSNDPITYPDTTNTVADKFNDNDNCNLCNAIAAGETCSDIKDFWFMDREDITAEDLEAQAYAIHAVWGEDEDYLLRWSGVDPDASVDELDELKERGYVHPSRDPEDIRTRIIHLLNSDEDATSKTSEEGFPHDEQLHSSQPNTSSYPTVDPDYPTTDLSPFIDPSVLQMEAASPTFAGPSSWSAQPCDGPPLPAQAFLGDDFGDEEHCGSEDGEQQPGDNEWADQRQTGSVPDEQDPAVGDARRRGHERILRIPLEESDLEDIKVKCAEGLSMAQICEKYYPDYTAHDIRNKFSGKWRQWTRKEDQELIRLHDEKGDEWAEISEKLPGYSRNVSELKARLKRLEKREEDAANQHKESYGLHKYTREEDNEIRRQLAQGITYAELVKQSKFRHLKRFNLAKHADRIGASWKENDDMKLQENVLGYEDDGTETDWGSIGRQYVPPRDAQFVAIRWERIKHRCSNLKESKMSEPAGRHEQAGESSQGQQNSVFNDHSSSQTYPENPSQYPTTGPSSFQPAAATLGHVNTRSAPNYGSAQPVYLSDPPNKPAHLRPRDSRATAHYRRQLEARLPEVKIRLAQGWTWQQVNNVYSPGYVCETMRQFLHTRGCSLWERQQDLHLLALRRDGLDWAQICAQLIGPPRTAEEAEERYRWL